MHLRVFQTRKSILTSHLLENNTYISNLRQKANIFNVYFADQCNILDNSSTLPLVVYITNASIYHINITINHIVGIINKMSFNKAGGGYDEISVRMLQLCASEIALPLQIIFRKCINTGLFPDKWKYADIQPIQKRTRQIRSNY